VKTPPSPEVSNNLEVLRQKRGLSVSSLAAVLGISRQTVYAIEAGRYVPNTAISLQLARVLEVRVEDLFSLPVSPAAPDMRTEQVSLLPGAEPAVSGQPVQLCQVDKRLVASAVSPFPWFLPSGDAIMTGKTRAQVCDPDADFGNRILIAGCDPGISVLVRHMRLSGVELIVAHRNSTQALSLLKSGSVHVAGTHLLDEASGESNIPEIGRIFQGKSVALFSFAVWEEGILTAAGNPKGIRGVEDFSRKDVCIVNRENGAGSRILLDSRLKRLKIGAGKVAGYRNLAPGHLAAAWQVQTRVADCCVATGAAARAFGLGFIPLVSERYDFAIRRQHLSLPSIQTLLNALSRQGFRRELESTGGYDTRVAGQQMM
jgi:molybdate-binding protein/DNA-binding XRE family transcriptional regulator